MKTCTRFHFADVERGDRLAFIIEGTTVATVTVARAFVTHNFGAVIVAQDGETYYLNDYDQAVEVKP